MPAPAGVGPRERAIALTAVALVQLALGLALVIGLRVSVGQPVEVVQRLVEIALPRTPQPVPPPQPPEPKPDHRSSPAPASQPKSPGGAPGPQPAHAPPSVAPVVAVRPSAAPSGGGLGAGPALGAGAGGGSGGQGYGGGGGGTDLEHIAGEILPSDYPRDLGNSGIGGRVGVLLEVGVNGHVTRCSIERSSGVAELDALTCRLMEQRFRFRPSTDRYGRPIADEVEWDHDWIAR